MAIKKINVALLGYGYWGTNILRNIVQNPAFGDIWLYDTNEAKAEKAKSQYSQIRIAGSYHQVLDDSNIHAVIVATPTPTHYTLCSAALQHGKHVLAEKPLTTSLAEAEELVALARAKSLVLMVDHIFTYNSAVRKLKTYLSQDQIGQLSYIDSTRINLGVYQSHTNVLWDLACHDISIINYLIDERPSAVSAIAKKNKDYDVEDLAYLFLHYDSGLMVHINTSWASPVKMRRMIIGGEKKMIIYDDIEPSNKLTVYEFDNSIAEDEDKKTLVDYRLGNISIPKFEVIESLKTCLEDFAGAILHQTAPLSDGQSALSVISIIEHAILSLQRGGEKISIR